MKMYKVFKILHIIENIFCIYRNFYSFSENVKYFVRVRVFVESGLLLIFYGYAVQDTISEFGSTHSLVVTFFDILYLFFIVLNSLTVIIFSFFHSDHYKELVSNINTIHTLWEDNEMYTDIVTKHTTKIYKECTLFFAGITGITILYYYDSWEPNTLSMVILSVNIILEQRFYFESVVFYLLIDIILTRLMHLNQSILALTKRVRTEFSFEESLKEYPFDAMEGLHNAKPIEECPNVRRAVEDLPNVKSIEGRPDVESAIEKRTDIGRDIDDSSYFISALDKLPNIVRVIDELPNIVKVIDDLPNIERVIDKLPNIGSIKKSVHAELERCAEVTRLLASTCSRLQDCFGMQISLSLYTKTMNYILFLYQGIYYFINKDFLWPGSLLSSQLTLTLYVSVMLLILVAGQRAQNEADKMETNMASLHNLLVTIPGMEAASCARTARALLRRMRAAPVRVRLTRALPVRAALLVDIVAVVLNYTIVLLQFNHVV